MRLDNALGDANKERLLDPVNESIHAEPLTEASIPERPRRSTAARAQDGILCSSTLGVAGLKIGHTYEHAMT